MIRCFVRSRLFHTKMAAMSLRNISSSRVQIPQEKKIALTEQEERICSLLDECTHFLKSEHDIHTSCRVAGGWVRDKLLGQQSNDLDIALSDMMGYPFAERFVAFVSEQKHLPVKSVSKVESNPDQSKHLETAKTKLFDIELEFVNLRSEEYAGDSRIPTDVKFGTPLEDALRRDITINALFYNVHSREVEDHTGKGLEDLNSGVIRTPMPPRETFRDDPLRVIRCVRFASRFGFDMVGELQDAARDSQIQDLISTKISRERVGEELDKMMKGRDPLRSIDLIDSLSLYPSIFTLPSDISSAFSRPPASHCLGLRAARILHALSNPTTTSTLPRVHPALQPPIEDRSTLARLYLACAITPYSGLTYTDTKGKQKSVVEAAIRDGLKLGTRNHYMDGVPALFGSYELLKEPRLDGGRWGEVERVGIGLALRDKLAHNTNTGQHWTTSLLFSLVQELTATCGASESGVDVLNVERATVTEVIETYNALMNRIEELDLPSAVDAKSILDGREVVQHLAVSRPGPWTGQVLAKVVEWQLANPKGTKDECAAWLKAKQSEGRIRIEDAAAPSKRTNGGNGKGAKKAKR